MAGHRVLVTNDTLNTRFGAETATRDLVLGLKSLGDTPLVYTPNPGCVSDEIQEEGITAVNDLRAVPFQPEIIHGNQHPEMIEALMAFPQARGIFVCHARFAWPATPPLTNRIQHYVAVDHYCLERLTVDYAVPSEKVSVIFNAVDTVRFTQRSPLPERPRRALVFSNYATDDNFLPAIRAACRQFNLPLDVIGAGAGNQIARPQDVLPDYDVVFAKARCALEAMTVGNAVILCDHTGLGPMVNSKEVAELRKWNFGMRVLQSPVTPMRILAELNRYDAADARLVSDHIREHSAATRLISEYSALYKKVMTIPLTVSENDLTESHRQMTQKMVDSESQFHSMRQSPRMKPLTASASTQINLANAKISAPLANGYLWAQCKITNGTSQRVASYQPAPVHLSYHWLDASGRLAVFEGLRTSLIPPLDPGSSAIYEVKIAGPPDPGEYHLRLTLVQEGVRWFDELPGSLASQEIPVTMP
jgi:Glycosyltransferase Family 4